MFRSVVEFVKNYKFSILLFFYLLLVVYFQVGLRPSNAVAIINIVAVFFLLNVLAKIRYGIIPVIAIAIWITFDAFYAFQYSSYVTLGSMASILETNSTETASVLHDIFFSVVGILAITMFLVLSSGKELKELSISKKISGLFLGLYLIVFIPFLSLGKLVCSGEYTFKEFVDNDPLLMTQMVVSNKTGIIYGDIISVSAYWKEMRMLKKYYNSERVIPEGISLDKDKTTPEKIYLVLGESSSRNYYSLYGYDVATTPFLDSLSVNKKAMQYYNAISPAALTRQSIPLILSFDSPSISSNKAFLTTKNLVELANVAGYETYWISNQDQMGVFEGYVSAIAMASKKEIYEKGHERDDLNLIPYLRDEHRPGVKQLFIIHLQGSHPSYNDKVDEIDRLAITGIGEYNQYGQSIHHTDRVLRELSKIAATDPSSLLYYISDHGEAVDRRGHGLLCVGLPQFEIPLITINKAYDSIDTIVSRYIDKKTNVINACNTIYIMAEAMGYNVAEGNVKQAVEEGKHLLHVDLRVHLYEDMVKEKAGK